MGVQQSLVVRGTVGILLPQTQAFISARACHPDRAEFRRLGATLECSSDRIVTGRAIGDKGCRFGEAIWLLEESQVQISILPSVASKCHLKHVRLGCRNGSAGDASTPCIHPTGLDDDAPIIGDMSDGD